MLVVLCGLGVDDVSIELMVIGWLIVINGKLLLCVDCLLD